MSLSLNNVLMGYFYFKWRRVKLRLVTWGAMVCQSEIGYNFPTSKLRKSQHKDKYLKTLHHGTSHLCKCS